MDSSNGPNDEAGHPSSLYERLEAYSFVTDAEFKLGLAALLGQAGTPVTDEQVNRTDDLVLQAKCFYFSKKYDIEPYIGLDGYKMWKQQNEQQASAAPAPAPAAGAGEGADTPSNGINSHAAPGAPASAAAAGTGANNRRTHASEAGGPAYPSSFAHIVELITTGQPIPGIQQIPDTVLTGHDGPSTAKQRPKPWEKQDEAEDYTHTNGTGETSDGADAKSEGEDDAGPEHGNDGMPSADAAAGPSS